MRNGRALLGIVLGLTSMAGFAANPIMGELSLEAATKAERDAGVWVDGQYVGYVRNLDGKDKLVLVPGEHRLTFKLVGYEPLERTIVVDPGEQSSYRVALQQGANVRYPDKDATARVRFHVEPKDAAIFVDEKYVGHVDRFDGRKGMRLSPGTYRFTIALPGYHPFNTELSVRAEQDYEVKTELPAAGYEDQAGELVSDTTIGSRGR